MDFYYNYDTPEAIREIQTYLRADADARLGNGAVPIDGVLGAATVAAIKKVQKRAGLKDDGVVDYATWLAIYAEFLEYEAELSAPLTIMPFPLQSGYKVENGEISDLVSIIQIMLNAISVDYDEIELREVNGIYGNEIAEDVKAFQIRNNLAPTGIVDKATWNALARAYEKYRDVSK